MKKIDVELKNIQKHFGSNVVVDRFDLQIEQGECVTFLGPSGCGKTTTLNMIAGFLEPDQGEIYIKGKIMNGVPANKRDLGMVFQTYSLFPHMTVEQNVAYGLKLRKVPKAEIKERVTRVLELVKLPHVADRFPKQLSGGQRQRIAIARALVTEPSLLLLDEPLSNLDAKLREELREELKRLQQEIGVTTIFVTHDQEEAMYLSDRIVVLSNGNVEQIGTPQEIYQSPTTEFVHEFIGKSNRFTGVVENVEGEILELRTDSGKLFRAHNRQTKLVKGDKVSIYVRPEKLKLSSNLDVSASFNTIQGSIKLTSFLGSYTECIVDYEGQAINCRIETHDNFSTGSKVSLSWNIEDVYVFARGEN